MSNDNDSSPTSAAETLSSVNNRSTPPGKHSGAIKNGDDTPSTPYYDVLRSLKGNRPKPSADTPYIMKPSSPPDSCRLSGSSVSQGIGDLALLPETCNLCNEELCTQCDPETDHVCGMYMEAARKRNGNALRGNEYMSFMTWSHQCMRNVVVPANFMRDLDIGTQEVWRGKKWWDMGVKWGLWAVATMAMLAVWPVLVVISVVMVLLEDSVWRDD